MTPLWDGVEPDLPVLVDAEPDEHILEPRCYCGRLLERAYTTPELICPVHGLAAENLREPF